MIGIWVEKISAPSERAVRRNVFSYMGLFVADALGIYVPVGVGSPHRDRPPRLRRGFVVEHVVVVGFGFGRRTVLGFGIAEHEVVGAAIHFVPEVRIGRKRHPAGIILLHLDRPCGMPCLLYTSDAADE